MYQGITLEIPPPFSRKFWKTRGGGIWMKSSKTSWGLRPPEYPSKRRKIGACGGPWSYKHISLDFTSVYPFKILEISKISAIFFLKNCLFYRCINISCKTIKITIANLIVSEFTMYQLVIVTTIIPFLYIGISDFL